MNRRRKCARERTCDSEEGDEVAEHFDEMEDFLRESKESVVEYNSDEKKEENCIDE